MKTPACGAVNPQPEVPFDDISDLVSGKGTPHEQEKTSPQEKTPTPRRIEYPSCFYDPAGIGGTAVFAYDNAQKVPCDQSGRPQAPAAGLMPFDKIILKKIDNIKMFLRVSLGGAINHDDGTREIIPRPAPIVILDYDHVLNPETGEYADGIPNELRDEIEYLKKHTYCEFSKSGAGIHAFCIDNLPEPVTKGDKPFLKIKADSKPEIFRGDSQVLCTGWRIPNACDDIHEIDISAIYTRQLGKSSVGKTPGRKKAGAEASPELVPDPVTEPEELTDEQIADLKDWIRDEAEYVANVLSEDYLQTTRSKKTGGKMGASELMMSIMVRICLDMAPAAISTGIPYHLLATPAHVERLWKCSEVYQTYYGSGRIGLRILRLSLISWLIDTGRMKDESSTPRELRSDEAFRARLHNWRPDMLNNDAYCPRMTKATITVVEKSSKERNAATEPGKYVVCGISPRGRYELLKLKPQSNLKTGANPPS